MNRRESIEKRLSRPSRVTHPCARSSVECKFAECAACENVAGLASILPLASVGRRKMMERFSTLVPSALLGRDEFRPLRKFHFLRGEKARKQRHLRRRGRKSQMPSLSSEEGVDNLSHFYELPFSAAAALMVSTTHTRESLRACARVRV